MLRPSIEASGDALFPTGAGLDTPPIYRIAFANAPNGVLIADPAGRIIDGNPAAAEILGRQVGDLIGMNGMECVHPDDAAAALERWANLTDGGSDFFESDHRYVTGSGDVISAVTRANLVRNAAGAPTHLVVHLIDTTSQVESARAGAVAEERFRTTFERGPVGVLLVGIDERTIAVNPALCEMLGRSEQELMDIAWDTIIHPDDLDEAIRLWAAAARDEGAWVPIELRFQHCDGRMIWTNTRGGFIRDDAGRPPYMLAQIIDIHDQKTSHMALQASEARYRRVFDRSPVALFEEDYSAVRSWLEAATANGLRDLRSHLTDHPEDLAELVGLVKVVEVNNAGVELLGAPSKEALLGPLPAIFTTPEDSEAWIEELLAFDERRDRLYLEFQTINMRGDHLNLALLWVSGPEFDSDDAHVTVGMMNITEQRRAEENLKALVRSKDEFIAAVSHELRTPLTAVVGFAEELATGWDTLEPDTARDYVGVIASEAAEVSNIVHDLLAAARVDMGRLTIRQSQVDLAALVTEVVNACSAETRARITLDLEPVSASADSTRTRQILRNLITNAIRYGGAQIDIATGATYGRAGVIVRDDGDGINEADIDRAFVRYESLSRAEGLPGSLGIGLSISRDLARMMSGDLTYIRSNGWSEFTLDLPAKSAGPL